MRKKKSTPKRFDFEALYLGAGMGIVSITVGVLIIWAKHTAPPGPSHSTRLTITQRIVNALPESIQGRIVIVLGVLFVLFGVIAVCLGLWHSVKNFFPRKSKDSSP